ncbi:4-diphosphocytidyl-2C-methyl-D-erythritol synthase [Methylosinus sp. R-45379]|uniref:nucleotidyltransferase family protein n=1 Tax=Methylosinus sp. R-45379 TaxID=980563 RepID=UPI0007C92F27|nr:nucleotidyltransferase family protein [Methylosinus sp. R-45379]OAI30585.1 4-diphosphocytidyl-2C-methyl-D-erythritol synthase [Methylosinus sp. R-45379]
MSSSVVALVLAAGNGERFGSARFKLLEELDGKPLMRHAVDAALASQAGRTLVVTGHANERVEAALAGAPVALVHNANYREGLASSLRAGVAQVGGESGALVLLADMPAVTPAILDILIDAFDATDAAAVVPTRNGRRGNPVLLGRTLFPQLATIAGDKGAREMLRISTGVIEIEIGDDAVLTDVDAPADLARLRSFIRS